MTTGGSRAGLTEYATILRAHRWVIVATALLCVVAAVALSARQDTKYQSTSRLDFQGDAQSLSAVGAPAIPLRTNKELAERGAQTVLQESSLRSVREKLRTDRSTDQLRNDLEVTVDSRSNLVSIIAQTTNRDFSAALANALAELTQRDAVSGSRKQLLNAATDLRRRQGRLGRSTRDSADYDLYSQQVTRLQALAQITTPVTIAKVAQPPDDPVSPKPLRDGAIALVIGLLLGLLIAFVRDALDRRLHSIEDVRATLDLPVVGQVRNQALGGVGQLSQDPKLEPADLESFAMIRANLRYLDVDRPLQVVAVTSAMPEEGKSTVAASLALACAVGGQRTLLIECDLRRPTLGGRLGLPTDGKGLTDYLAGDASPGDVLHTVELPSDPVDATANGHTPQPAEVRPTALVAVLAGSASLHPAELLSSRRFSDLISQVREAYDMVIVDTSPMLTVADTLELLPQVDCTLLCVRAGQTTRDAAKGLDSALERVPHGAMGLVITGVQHRRDTRYGYYTYDYQQPVDYQPVGAD